MKNKINEIMEWTIRFILLISTTSLLWIHWFGSYGAEGHLARALPLSIVIGLTAIATVISGKD